MAEKIPQKSPPKTAPGAMSPRQEERPAAHEVTPFESFFEGMSPFGLTFGRLFDDFLGRRMLRGDGDQWFAPAMDVSEDENAYRIAVELPGMRKEDVKIELENDVLCISGEKKAEKQGHRRMERRYGAFCRTLTLPSGVDADAATAEMKEGLLEITLPKKPEAKPKTLPIT